MNVTGGGGTKGCLSRYLLTVQSPRGSRGTGELEAAEATRPGWVGTDTPSPTGRHTQPHRQYSLNEEYSLLKAKKNKPSIGAGLQRTRPLLSQISSRGPL